jgi:hypothetical protein
VVPAPAGLGRLCPDGAGLGGEEPRAEMQARRWRRAGDRSGSAGWAQTLMVDDFGRRIALSYRASCASSAPHLLICVTT